MSTETETLVVDQEKVTKKLQAALAFLRKHPDWMAHANAYVMDTYNAPNLMHFMSNGSTLEQKDECADRLIQAIKMGNRGLLGDFDIGGEVKPENEPEPEEAPKQEVAPASEPKPTKKPKAPSKPISTGDRLTDLILENILPLVEERIAESSIDEGQVHEAVDKIFKEEQRILRKKVDDFLAAVPPREVVVIKTPPETIELPGRHHFKFGLLTTVVSAEVPAFLVGPAGTGKSTAAMDVAKALGLDYEIISVGPQTSKGDLFGFKDANGTYHETGLVRAYRDGKLFLMDEIDAAHPGVLTMINLLMSNGKIVTPGGTFERHKDFRFVAAANTFGVGGNRQYVGRNHLDAATLDRFAFIEWPIDEGFEASLIGIDKPSREFEWQVNGETDCTKEEWLCTVTEVRNAVEKLGIRHVVSPRATIYGSRLLDAGINRDTVKSMLLFKGLDESDVRKVLEHCQQN